MDLEDILKTDEPQKLLSKINENFGSIAKFLTDLNEKSIKIINLARLNGAEKDAKLYVFNDDLAVFAANNIRFPKPTGVMYKTPAGYHPIEQTGMVSVRNSTENITPVVMVVDTNGDVRTLGNLNDTSAIFALAVWAINKEES